MLNEKLLPELIQHIKSNAVKRNIYIDSINGYREHIHCLISLNPDMALSRSMQLIKGESSFWINKHKLTEFKFEWAVEYYGASVSYSDLSRVRRYIRNQAEHHRKKTWDEEKLILITEMGFKEGEG
jgi:REP element-mobilizing transposase RayT